MALVFVIVGRDELVYESRFATNSNRDDHAHMDQFVLHSALDMVEEKMWRTQSMSLGVVDEFNEVQVHAWITADGARFMLLHENVTEETAKKVRVEENIKNFFGEVNDLYAKVALNPFYEIDTVIRSHTFDSRVQAVSRKYGLV
mmetsp:Transcript_10246/g.19232  ORF Transcript_10246/g.19232 Transcript_10246/m.19232 type:complete len:144 (+) Transcript_10246:104-535(+)